MLKKQKTLYNVFPITTAKVPIVKFKHRPLQLEGDISLYNTLVSSTVSEKALLHSCHCCHIIEVLNKASIVVTFGTAQSIDTKIIGNNIGFSCSTAIVTDRLCTALNYILYNL